MKKFFIFFSIFILFLSACSTEEAPISKKENAKSTIEKNIKTAFRTSTDFEYVITPNKGKYDVKLTFVPSQNFFTFKSEKGDKDKFSALMYGYIKRIYSSGNINNIEIKAIASSEKLVANPTGQLHIISQNNETIEREIAYINVSSELLENLTETYEDPQFKFGEHIIYYPFFLVELKLKSSKTGIKNLMVGDLETDPETNQTQIEIRYEPINVKAFGAKDTDKKEFEDNFANIIRFSFEADPAISKIKLISQVDFVDNRTNINTSTIATYEATREEFEIIMNNWDNYRYKIFEKINYSDIFLLDLVSTSKITSAEINNNAEIELFYDADYKTISNSVDTLEKDASEIIYNLFKYNKKIDKIDMNIKCLLPAKPGDESADGVHKIIHNGFQLSVTRANVEAVNKENLNYKQYLFNFNPVWNNELLELNIKDNLNHQDLKNNRIYNKDNIRKVDIISNSEVEIELNVCEFKKDMETKEKGSTSKCGEDCVVKRLESLGKFLIFESSPPFIEKITFQLNSVFLDSKGFEDVEDFGNVVIDKDPEANFFFQEKDASDLDWIESDDNLDIDEENMCQIG